MSQTATEEKTIRNKPAFDDSKQIKSLATYYSLGRTGLRVSPLSLGTATFGTTWGQNWNTDKEESKAIFKRYVEAGGNFIDTADSYHEGQSEEITAEFVKAFANRDSLVLATKYTFGTRPGDPNSGGNSRKHMMTSVEGSLRRLKTDYIDLYWVHNWDTSTPAEEVMSGLNAIVQSGKVRYIGLSNPPAWYVARAQTIAELRGWERVAALQMEYSLAMRNIEYEYTAAALEMGMAIVPWSPLANGLLSGKYKREGNKLQGAGRLLDSWITDPHINLGSDKILDLVDGLQAVAKEIGRTPAQVALNWITHRPGVVSTIIGATKLAQLEDNIQAMEFEIPKELVTKLDELSKPASTYPYFYHEGEIKGVMLNNTRTVRQSSWYQGA